MGIESTALRLTVSRSANLANRDETCHAEVSILIKGRITRLWSAAQFAEEDDNGNVGMPWAMLLADGWLIE